MSKDLVCPRCDHFLIRTNIRNGYVLTCEGCQGVLAGTGLLHQITESFVIGKIIASAKPDIAMKCSHCKNQMISGEFSEDCPSPITASACKDCFVMFMDLYELDFLKKNFPKNHTAKRPDIAYFSSVDPAGADFYRRYYYTRMGFDAINIGIDIVNLFS